MGGNGQDILPLKSDVAILPVSQLVNVLHNSEKPVYYRHIFDQIIPTSQQLWMNSDAMEDQCCSIGYPLMAFDDEVNISGANPKKGNNRHDLLVIRFQWAAVNSLIPMRDGHLHGSSWQPGLLSQPRYQAH